MKYKYLQNGSDIRGTAMEGIEGEKINLTEEIAFCIAAAFSEILAKKTGKETVSVAVGRDSRITGEKLLQAAAKGIVSKGNKPYDGGLASTPSMYMSLKRDDIGIDGSIMITASHLPFNRNGMKFFFREGGADKNDIMQILENAEKIQFKQIEAIPEKIDIISDYSKNLVDYIRKQTGEKKPLENSRIIVDAGNGSAGFFASEVLGELGANTGGSLYLDPDGYFPNHIPNPEDKKAVEDLKKAVITNRADLGIIFDTDVDRAAIVDENGRIINRNRLIALISAIVLQQYPGTYIVTDSVTSKGLKKFIESKGGIHHRFKRGYNNVIKESVRLNENGKESWLAIETSGHCAFRENYFLDDGAYLIVKILVEFAKLKKNGKRLADLIKDYEEPAEEKEIRKKITAENFVEYGNMIIEDLKKTVKLMDGWTLEEPNYEGVRINCSKESGNGWFLLRLSLHDPVIPINIESDEKGGAEKIQKEIERFLDSYESIQ